MSDKEQPRELTFGIGDNSDMLRTGDALTEYLEDAYAADLVRVNELLEKGEKYLVIESDEEDAGATEFMVSVRSRYKDSEASRVKEKAPFLDAGGRVDGFFNTKVLDVLARAPSKKDERFDPVERNDLGLGVRINRAQTIYKTAKLKREQEARDAAAAEARRIENEKRAEAMRLQQAADAAREQETAASEQRSAATAAAAAPAADITRERGERGGVSSLKTWVNFRDVDKQGMIDEVRTIASDAGSPAESLTIFHLLPFIDDKALEKAVKGWIDANKGAAQSAIKNKQQPMRCVVLFEDYKNAGRA